MSARLRDDQGSALVSAIVLTTVMLMLGLAFHAAADTQQSQSGQERVSESAFSRSEGALNGQVFQVARSFPFVATRAHPASCTPTSPAAEPCPTAETLGNSYTGGDYGLTSCNGVEGPAWTTRVRDNANGAEQYYASAIVNGNATWDSNGDGALWVRAEGASGCRRRTLVTLVRANDVQIPFPRNVVTANWFATTNQGRKVIVDTEGKFAQPPQVRPDPKDTSAQPADVSVRCTGLTPSTCLQYDPSRDQVSPNTAKVAASPDPLLTDSQVESIKARARSLGTYYAAGVCPPTLTGETVYVEDLGACGPYPGGNTAQNPGLLVVERGTLSLGGNAMFYGVVYMRNKQASSGAVVSIQGTAGIQGAVAIDGLGGVSAGSSRTNIVFDPRAASLVKGLGSAAAVPNTWRELPAGQ